MLINFCYLVFLYKLLNKCGTSYDDRLNDLDFIDIFKYEKNDFHTILF